MFEDIFAPIPRSINPPKKPKKPTNRFNLKKKKTPRPPKIELTPFEVVKEIEDIRMLAKVLDLCKSKIRRQKRKARRERKNRRR